MDDAASRQEALARARIFADPRKFREYVLVPGYPGGKDRIFLGTLGFRPHSTADAWELARSYEEQARKQVASGNAQFGGTILGGDRYTIVIAVRGAALRTGWLLSDDVLRLITPFSGSCAARGEVDGMSLPEFSLIRLTTDRFVKPEGVERGAIGVILEVFDDGYVVEFSRPDGTTIAWFSVEPEDVEPAPEAMLRTEHVTS